MKDDKLAEEINVVLGRHIRNLRNDKDFSQEELAFRANFTYRQLIDIEKGRSGFTTSTLYDLSKGLDVKPTTIIKPLDDLYNEKKNIDKE
ncbi:helix-turn-helix domain-containing protein [Evansella clarkii]|uniref:helix-turn-helix domain-containing protein n=1 Tax=Evansella clarkii TaxID=79879 RepID=UPI0014745015|nr:helix-turn-helix transcriptional regulator [Evansella clarkii]